MVGEAISAKCPAVCDNALFEVPVVQNPMLTCGEGAPEHFRSTRHIVVAFEVAPRFPPCRLFHAELHVFSFIPRDEGRVSGKVDFDLQKFFVGVNCAESFWAREDYLRVIAGEVRNIHLRLARGLRPLRGGQRRLGRQCRCFFHGVGGLAGAQSRFCVARTLGGIRQ